MVLTCPPLQLLSEAEIETMKKAVNQEKPVGNNKILEPTYKLITGRPVDAAHGLENRMCVQDEEAAAMFHGLIGKGVEGIQEGVDSFASTHADDPDAQEVKALLHYIRFEKTSSKDYPNGIRDDGRGTMMLTDFMENQKVQQAKLSEAEIVAIRLYTTIAYIFMNKPLRDNERYEQGKQCPLAVTTHFAVLGVKKLRALHVEAGQTTLWRGMRNLEVAEDFMKQGGTELAFMSTTLDLNVAVRYCLSPQSLLFKIVVTNFMSMGADVHWLSAFPKESEVLYPPLTYLEPTGRIQVRLGNTSRGVCEAGRNVKDLDGGQASVKYGILSEITRINATY